MKISQPLVQLFVEVGCGDPNSVVYPEEPNVPVEMITAKPPAEIDPADPHAPGGETAFAWQ